MCALKVLDPGLLTTIQDSGRFGFRKYGVPTSGAMDIKAYNISNWLVGNVSNEAVLEFTVKGGRYRFEADALIAITGALMGPKINDIEIPMNSSISVKSGDTLELGFSNRGCRAYLAIKGKLHIERIMNSYSTYTIGMFGGFKGRTLRKDDIIEWTKSEEEWGMRKISNEEIPYYSSKVTFNVMKGMEWDWLENSVQQEFLNSEFKVSSQSNRMGIRLQGVTLDTPGRDMISSPVIPGIIQLPPNGVPIILSQDGQTIGGYPRIAKVPDDELWRLGQLKPGDSVSFKLI